MEWAGNRIHASQRRPGVCPMKCYCECDLTCLMKTLPRRADRSTHGIERAPSSDPKMSLRTVRYMPVRLTHVAVLLFCCLCTGSFAWAVEQSSMQSQVGLDESNRILIIEDPRPMAELPRSDRPVRYHRNLRGCRSEDFHRPTAFLRRYIPQTGSTGLKKSLRDKRDASFS